MNREEQIAWIIDPEAFSLETQQLEKCNPRNDGTWRARRTTARKKARVILALTNEFSS